MNEQLGKMLHPDIIENAVGAIMDPAVLSGAKSDARFSIHDPQPVSCIHASSGLIATWWVSPTVRPVSSSLKTNAIVTSMPLVMFNTFSAV